MTDADETQYTPDTDVTEQTETPAPDAVAEETPVPIGTVRQN